MTTDNQTPALDREALRLKYAAQVAEAEKIAAERAAEKLAREAKAALKAAAEKAILDTAMAVEGTPPTIAEYADLEAVKAAEMSETSIKTVLDRFAVENEDSGVTAEGLYSGKARSGDWNGRVDLARMLYSLSKEATGTAPATMNQNLVTKLQQGTLDPNRSKADQLDQYNRDLAIAKLVPAKTWERIVKSLETAYATAEAAYEEAAKLAAEEAAKVTADDADKEGAAA